MAICPPTPLWLQDLEAPNLELMDPHPLDASHTASSVRLVADLEQARVWTFLLSLHMDRPFSAELFTAWVGLQVWVPHGWT